MGTFKNLVLSEEARLLFGKKEQEIIRKQLNGEKLSQSQRNVLSRSIRKKLNFILKLVDFKEKFKLEYNIENKKLIDKVVNTILEDKSSSKIKAILLFGSFANNTQIFRSDIDICVIFDKNLSLKEIFDFRIRILGNFSLKIDLQVFNFLPRKIQKSIVMNYKILYKTKDFNNEDFFINNIKQSDFDLRMQNFFGVKI